RDPVPARDARVDAVLERPLAEIRSPWPAGEVHVDRAGEWNHARRPVSTDDHWPQVAGVELVALDQLTAGRHELVYRILQIHSIDLGGVHHALQMVLQAKNRRSASRVVTTNPLEYRGAELHGMRKHMNLRVLPANELAVAPDPIRFGKLVHEGYGL